MVVDAYAHGHHPSVLRSHSWRTAENSAAYFTDRLRPGMRVLDIGSGPGSITADLAAAVAPGETIGIDAAEEVVATAIGDAAPRGLENLRFETGDGYEIDYPAGSFDVVHTHQVLQHVREPVAMLAEMHRVTASGGFVAAREVDYERITWSAGHPVLDEWLALYLQVHRGVSGEPAAGRHLEAWARNAGLGADLSCSESTWLFDTPADRAWWGGMWAERVIASAFAENALRLNLADTQTLERISAGWQRWAADSSSWLLMPHSEIVAVV